MKRVQLPGLCMLLFYSLVRETLALGVDAYAPGFHTRGVDAGIYVDREDSDFAPFYMPLGPRWVLLPRITVSAALEDNPTLSSGPTERAETVYVVPGLMLLYGRPERNHVYADAGMILPVHSSDATLDEKPSYLLVMGGWYRTGRSSVHARAGYRRLESVDTLVGARIAKVVYTGDANLEYRISSKTSAGLLGSVAFHDYEENRYIDYRRYYGGTRFYHRITPKSDGFVQLGIGHDDLQQQQTGRLGDADFYDVSIGLRGKQSTKTHISGRLGYRWRRPVDDDLEDVNHYIASVRAETTPFGLTTFSGELLTDIRPSSTDAGTVTVEQRATAGVSRRLISERIRGQAYLFYGLVDYYGEEGRPVEIREDRPLVIDGREDYYWGYSLGLSWWLQHNISIGVSYSYFENVGNHGGTAAEQAQASYTAGRWALRASWNY